MLGFGSFLPPIHNWQDSLDGSSPWRKASTYTWGEVRNTIGIHNFRDWCCNLYNGCIVNYGTGIYWESAAGWKCWLFTSFHLEPCIWPDEISRWIRQRNSVKFSANLGKSATDSLAMIGQAFRGGSLSRTLKVQTHRDRNRRDRRRAKPRACSSFSMISTGLFTKNFTATAWKCAKTSLRIFATKELAVAPRQRTVSLPFYPGIFSPKTIRLPSPPTPYFYFFPRLKVKQEDRHFDTAEVIEAESRAVLNSLTEHDSKDTIQNDRSAGNGAYSRKGLLWGWWCSRPKVSFDQMAAPVPEIMDGSL
jgi:hypothetical protein